MKKIIKEASGWFKKSILAFVMLLLINTTYAQVKISELPTYTGTPSGVTVPVLVAGINRKMDGFYFANMKVDSVWLVGTSLFVKKNGTTNTYTVISDSIAAIQARIQTKSPLTGSSNITTVGTLTSGSIPYSLLTGTPTLSLKLNVSDTTSMLSGYGRFGQVVKYSDTASMLGNRLKISDTATMLSGYGKSGQVVKYSDTAVMLNNLLRKKGNAATQVSIGVPWINSNTFTVTQDSGEARMTITSLYDKYNHDPQDSYVYYQLIRNNQNPSNGQYRPLLFADLIGRIGARGPVNTSGTYNGDGSLGIDFYPTENWSNSASGSRIGFRANITGTNTTYFPLYLNNDYNYTASVTAIGNGVTSNIFEARTTSAAGSPSFLVNKNGLTKADSLTINNTVTVGSLTGTGNRMVVANSAGVLSTQTIPSGTVTSISTNSGTGLSGGTITTTGTLLIDTLNISTRLWRQKAVDSLNALIGLRVKYTDTSAMLAPYARTSNLPSQYWQRVSTNLSPATAGDGIRVPDNSNSFVTLIGSSSIQTGANGGDYVYMNGSHGFYQSGPNKQLDIKSRNLTANRTVWVQNKDYTLADSAVLAPIAAGTLTLTTAAQPNITSVGSLSSLSVTGNLAVSGTQNIITNLDIGKSGGDYATLGYNVGFTNVSGSWNYRFSDASSFMRFYNGTIEFYTAASGTGGSAMSPTKVLSLATNGNANFSSVSTGTVYSNAGVLTNTNPSDSSLKDSIKALPYGLKEVLELNPKTFYYKSDTGHTSLKYGFIAQDVKKVMPDMVRKIDPKNPESKLGLETDGIYVTLINAIKDQQKQIESQQLQIENLRYLLDEIKLRVAKLENK